MSYTRLNLVIAPGCEALGVSDGNQLQGTGAHDPCLSARHGGTPVRVTCIAPGLAETEFSLVRFHGDAQQADAVYTGTQPLTAEDVAAAVVWALQQPPHVNINQIELMPTGQAWGPLAVHRDSG